MLLCCRSAVLITLILFSFPAFCAEWHKVYEKGRDKIKSGDCAQGQSLMMEALRGNPKPDARTPTYGTMVIEYFPQFYLAICAAEAGKVQEARRYLREAEGGRIGSSKLAKEYQTLRSKLDTLEQQGSAKTPEVKAPEQPQNQQQQKVPPKIELPPEKQTAPPGPVDAVIDKRPAIDSYLRQSREALQNGRYDEARSAANRALALQPDNREARTLLNEIGSRQVAELQTREKQEKIKDAERAMNSGDLNAAENLALALKVQYPSDRTVAGLLQQINKRKNAAAQNLKTDEFRKTAEREVLTAYYNGNYDQAIQLGKQNLSGAQSWNLYFFLGCSYAALSILEENDSETRLRLARDYFRRARKLSASTTLPPYISPKILEIYRSS